MVNWTCDLLRMLDDAREWRPIRDLVMVRPIHPTGSFIMADRVATKELAATKNQDLTKHQDATKDQDVSRDQDATEHQDATKNQDASRDQDATPDPPSQQLQLEGMRTRKRPRPSMDSAFRSRKSTKMSSRVRTDLDCDQPSGIAASRPSRPRRNVRPPDDHPPPPCRPHQPLRPR